MVPTDGGFSGTCSKWQVELPKHGDGTIQGMISGHLGVSERAGYLFLVSQDGRSAGPFRTRWSLGRWGQMVRSGILGDGPTD
ncbi:hypothetical protein [Pontibacter sp. G13]|uniref:hypothetical protein n=1 Tax=Pontibacter sp. G13 TaxID=3074898 RepID=UPI00288B4591|nr:hypothetical protein [Pontibacter sp. G13]WNJ20244.1 hypothetical protein RJD25_07170 [Pontibacter sp. G13]